jgi:hypothetical protein
MPGSSVLSDQLQSHLNSLRGEGMNCTVYAYASDRDACFQQVKLKETLNEDKCQHDIELHWNNREKFCSPTGKTGSASVRKAGRSSPTLNMK